MLSHRGLDPVTGSNRHGHGKYRAKEQFPPELCNVRVSYLLHRGYLGAGHFPTHTIHTRAARWPVCKPRYIFCPWLERSYVSQNTLPVHAVNW